MSIKIKIVMLFMIHILSNFSLAQSEHFQKENPQIIRLREFYDGGGIIFTKDDKFIRTSKDDKQISLTSLDVFEAEKILDSVTNIKFQNDPELLNRIKSKRRKYNRQYWGVQIPSGDKLVQIYIFNFSNDESILYFNSWYQGQFISTDPFWGENTRIYRINLTQKELEAESSKLELD